MSIPTLVLIESNTTGNGRRLAELAQASGFRVVLLAADPDRYNFAAKVDTKLLDTSRDLLVLNTLTDLAHAHRVVGVASTADHHLVSAAVGAQLLGAPGPDPGAVRRCRNKADQMNMLRAAGLPTPAGWMITTRSKDPRLGRGPFVVKPVSGTGSCDVRRHDAAGDAIRAARTVANGAGAALIQRMVTGPEVSVEILGDIVGVTGKHLGDEPFFVETGHDHPAVLPTSQIARCGRVAAAAAAALNVGRFGAHVEMRLTLAGPVIIEVNPRLPGGTIVDLIRLSSGRDLIAELLGLLTGSPRASTADSVPRGGASTRFLIPPSAGTITRITGVGEARAVPGIVHVALPTVGTTARLRGDFRDRVGHVVCRAATSADAARLATRAANAISFMIEANQP